MASRTYGAFPTTPRILRAQGSVVATPRTPPADVPTQSGSRGRLVPTHGGDLAHGAGDGRRGDECPPPARGCPAIQKWVASGASCTSPFKDVHGSDGSVQTCPSRPGHLRRPPPAGLRRLGAHGPVRTRRPVRPPGGRLAFSTASEPQAQGFAVFAAGATWTALQYSP